MPNYRRNRIPGRCYFFTVNLLEGYQNTLLVDEIDLLRVVVKQARDTHAFRIDGWRCKVCNRRSGEELS